MATLLNDGHGRVRAACCDATFFATEGPFIDCTLETAIDSTLPGMTTCITATDTFSVDGRVVLLERGSKLVGETQGDVRQGRRGLRALDGARTPTGIVVPLPRPAPMTWAFRTPGTGEQSLWNRFGRRF